MFKHIEEVTNFDQINQDNLFAGKRDSMLSFSESAQDIFFRMSPDLFCISSDAGLFLHLNPAWESVLGYAPDELLNKSFVDLLHPDDVDYTLKEYEEQLKGKLVLNFINRYRCKDGTYKWLEWRGTVNPKEKKAYAVARDISDSKNIKELLISREYLINAISHAARESVIMLGPDGNITYWNKASADIFGYQEKEVLGKNLHEQLVPERFKKGFYQFFPHFQSSGQGAAIGKTVKLFGVRKSGAEFPVELSLSAFKQEDKWHAIGILHDITERLAAEEAQKRLADLIELAHDSIMVRDMNDRIIYWNSGCVANYGFTKDEALGKVTHELLKTQFSEPVETVNQIIIENGYWEGELVHTTKFNKQVTVASRWQLRRNSQQLPVEIFEINNDITEKKQAMLALEASEENLRQLNITKDKFFSIIAHDLRSPFTSFLGITELLDEKYNVMSEREIADFLHHMNVSAKNLFRLLENLLEWSKMERGLEQVDKVKIHLLKSVKSNINQLQGVANQKGIEIEADVPDNIFVFADEKMLDSIIRNLLSNAIKFSNIGSKIFIHAHADGYEKAEICIEDSGIGMNQKMLDNLFKIDVNTSRKGTLGESSSGLGLILSREFVLKNGGNIWVRSAVNQGSAFYFTLPCQVMESNQDHHGVSSDAVEKEIKKINILIVDDDFSSRLYLTHLLKQYSNNMCEAVTGNEAITCFRKHPEIQLILMDINMPDKNGMEAIREIRKISKDVVIIVQTAIFLKEGKNDALLKGSNDYLAKPILSSDVIALLKKYFSF